MIGELLIPILIMVAFIALGSFTTGYMLYKKVPKDKALIKTGLGGIDVSFTGRTIVPIIHQMEMMDISVKKLEIERIGRKRNCL